MAKRLLFGTLLAVAFVYLMVVWGLVPYRHAHGGIALWFTGFAKSVCLSGWLSYPANMGIPHGAPIVFGLPYVYLQAILIRGADLPPLVTHSVVGNLFLAVSLYSSFRVARSLGLGPILSLIMAVGFLAQPIFWVHVFGFGTLGFALALLPLVWYMTQQRELPGEPGPWLTHSIRAFIGSLVGFTFLIFMDGYSFVMGLALISGMALVQIFFSKDGREAFVKVARLGAIVAGAVGASVAYRLYVGESYPAHNLFAFWVYGADLESIFVPEPGVSRLFDMLGLSESRNPGEYWGLGLSSTIFIRSISFLGLVGILLIRKPISHRIGVLAILVASALLALGPNVKYSDRIPDSLQDRDEPKMQLLQETYQNSPGIPLPTMQIFERVPGVNVMRATYRWLALTKFMFWIGLCSLLVFVASQQHRYYRYAAVLLAIFYVADTSPSPFARDEFYAASYRTISRIDNDLSHELGGTVKRGEKVIFYPFQNDFVSHYITPINGLYSFNVGGDKNIALAQPAWPRPVQELAANRQVMQSIGQILDCQIADAVVLVLFNQVRGWVNDWPPTDDERRRYLEGAKSVLERLDEGYDVKSKEDLIIVKPRKTGEESCQDNGA